MSKLLTQNKEFIQLLLKTSKDQSTALLQTTTADQVSVLSEIVLNLLHIPLGKKPKYLINKNKKILERIADKRTSKEIKRKLLIKNYKHILQLLWSVRIQLQELI